MGSREAFERTWVGYRVMYPVERLSGISGALGKHILVDRLFIVVYHGN